MDGDHCYKFVVVVDYYYVEIVEMSGGSGLKNDGRDYFRFRHHFPHYGYLLFYAYEVWAGVVFVVEGTHFGHWINYRSGMYYLVFFDYLRIS